MKINLDQFVPRAVLFALVNAILIGLVLLLQPSKLSFDNVIIISTLVSIAAGLPFEIIRASKNDRMPDFSGGWGAAIFGSIVAAFIITAIHLL